MGPYQAPERPYDWQYGPPMQAHTGWAGFEDQQYHSNKWQGDPWPLCPSKNEVYIGNLHSGLTEQGRKYSLPPQGLEQVKVINHSR